MDYLSDAKFLIVDDCSVVLMPRHIMKTPEIDVYRIVDDKPWNQTGARNLIHEVAETDWVLSTDCDHVVSKQEFEKISKLDMSDPDKVYFFSRKFTHGNKNNRMHSSFLINRHTYNEIGGHDEDLAGNYGGVDQSWMEICQSRLDYTWVDDIKITTYQNHPLYKDANVFLERNSSHNMNLIAAKRKKDFPRGEMIRFNWVKL